MTAAGDDLDTPDERGKGTACKVHGKKDGDRENCTRRKVDITDNIPDKLPERIGDIGTYMSHQAFFAGAGVRYDGGQQRKKGDK